MWREYKLRIDTIGRGGGGGGGADMWKELRLGWCFHEWVEGLKSFRLICGGNWMAGSLD